MRWNLRLARRWACLILGGALLMPYMMAGVLVAGWAQRESTTLLLLPIQLGVFAAVLPVVAVTGLFLPVRGLAVNTAQSLLGAAVETAPQEGRRSWQERRRTAAWYTLHLAIGGVASGCTLAVVPFTAVTVALPFTGDPAGLLGVPVEPGWAAIGWPAAGLAMLALLVLLVTWSGGLLARVAPPLLGPTPSERLAAAEARARTLAQRNRLARELHDSVGHALSVVTLQAAAAGRVLDRDPATARTALAAIEQSARSALEDLDHVLGVLRAGDDRDRAPGSTLADLDALVRATGAEVRRDVGDLSPVPAVVSREAYRIVQEALTNALRHGNGPVRLSAHVHDAALHLEITNPTGADGRETLHKGGGHSYQRATARAAGDAATEETAFPGRTATRDTGRGETPTATKAAGARETHTAAEGAGARETHTATGDSGVGKAPAGAGGGGRGLAGMRERARLLGGEVMAGPGQGGWRVSARLPLRSEP